MRIAESFEDKRRIWLKRPTYHRVLDLALKSPDNSAFQIERSTIRQHHVYLDNTMQYKWQYFRRDIAILLSDLSAVSVQDFPYTLSKVHDRTATFWALWVDLN